MPMQVQLYAHPKRHSPPTETKDKDRTDSHAKAHTPSTAYPSPAATADAERVAFMTSNESLESGTQIHGASRLTHPSLWRATLPSSSTAHGRCRMPCSGAERLLVPFYLYTKQINICYWKLQSRGISWMNCSARLRMKAFSTARQ